jgi:hypothetical protein
LTQHPYHKKLARVLDRMGGYYTVQDILSAVAIGKMQSFVEGDSWAITEITVYPRAKVLNILVALGDLEETRVLHDRLLAFAEEVGASVVQAYGRKGWLPDAKRRGWRVKAKSYVYQKDM